MATTIGTSRVDPAAVKGAVRVRVDIYSGDDLEDVQFVELDREAVKELISFARTGRCDGTLLQRLADIMEEVLPALSGPLSSLDANAREWLCAAYALRTGQEVAVTARLRRQLK
jgi:hypothetical protein